MPSPEKVKQWMDEGDIEQLENLVLNGRSSLLKQPTNCSKTRDFLNALPQYQAKISAIHRSVEEGDVRRVRNLIGRPAMALAMDKYGATPLHNAVLFLKISCLSEFNLNFGVHGQTDTIRFLAAKYPESVNATDNSGRTPLHYAVACTGGDVIVRLLQKAGGDAFVEDQYGHTPFYYRSNPAQLSPLKRQKFDLVTKQLLQDGLVHYLLQDLEEEIVEWLQVGNLAKLEELVLSGFGDLLLGKVAQVEDKEVLSFLEVLPQYQAKIQAIHRGIEEGNLQKVKLLLDCKKLALARDRKGATPLHKAVIYKNEEITKWLLRNYPQAVNALDHNKRTPLHYAAALSPSDNAQTYRLLLKASANTSIEDGYGKTARYYLHHPSDLNLEMIREECRQVSGTKLQQRVAPSYLKNSIQMWIKEGNVQKLNQMVLSGCGDLLQVERPEPQNPAVQTFLTILPTYLENISLTHKAIREGDMKMLKELTANKKLALARDRKGATPLHDALLYQQTDAIRYLASTFPNVVNAADYNRRTALHYAATVRDGGHYYKILEKAGADGTLTDKEGKTPLYYKDYVPNLSIDWNTNAEAQDDTLSRSDSIISGLDTVTPPDLIEDGEMELVETVSEIESGNHRFNKNGKCEKMVRMCSQLESAAGNILWPRGGGVSPVTEDGKFLAKAVGMPLTKALAELAIVRPKDPIQFVSDFLLNYDGKIRGFTNK